MSYSRSKVENGKNVDELKRTIFNNMTNKDSQTNIICYYLSNKSISIFVAITILELYIKTIDKTFYSILKTFNINIITLKR